MTRSASDPAPISSKSLGERFKEGQEQSLTIQLTEEVAQAFTQWSGDCAPLHTDSEFARSRGFEQKVVHGAALFSLVSRFVGLDFPGPDSLWMKADVKFHSPCYAPNEITITGVVSLVSESTSSVILAISVTDQQGTELMTVKSFHKIMNASE